MHYKTQRIRHEQIKKIKIKDQATCSGNRNKDHNLSKLFKKKNNQRKKEKKTQNNLCNFFHDIVLCRAMFFF